MTVGGRTSVIDPKRQVQKKQLLFKASGDRKKNSSGKKGIATNFLMYTDTSMCFI